MGPRIKRAVGRERAMLKALDTVLRDRLAGVIVAPMGPRCRNAYSPRTTV